MVLRCEACGKDGFTSGALSQHKRYCKPKDWVCACGNRCTNFYTLKCHVERSADTRCAVRPAEQVPASLYASASSPGMFGGLRPCRRTDPEVPLFGRRPDVMEGFSVVNRYCVAQFAMETKSAEMIEGELPVRRVENHVLAIANQWYGKP